MRRMRLECLGLLLAWPRVCQPLRTHDLDIRTRTLQLALCDALLRPVARRRHGGHHAREACEPVALELGELRRRAADVVRRLAHELLDVARRSLTRLSRGAHADGRVARCAAPLVLVQSGRGALGAGCRAIAVLAEGCAAARGAAYALLALGRLGLLGALLELVEQVLRQHAALRPLVELRGREAAVVVLVGLLEHDISEVAHAGVVWQLLGAAHQVHDVHAGAKEDEHLVLVDDAIAVLVERLEGELHALFEVAVAVHGQREEDLQQRDGELGGVRHHLAAPRRLAEACEEGQRQRARQHHQVSVLLADVGDAEHGEELRARELLLLQAVIAEQHGGLLVGDAHHLRRPLPEHRLSLLHLLALRRLRTHAHAHRGSLAEQPRRQYLHPWLARRATACAASWAFWTHNDAGRCHVEAPRCPAAAAT
mmetsp:Transcript_9452/g.33237  ORF Transcript_9452/g.33237 Transcript_9452/m.33237 type:complete len:426 (-) Transcript_9452:527-1804(-)